MDCTLLNPTVVRWGLLRVGFVACLGSLPVACPVLCDRGLSMQGPRTPNLPRATAEAKNNGEGRAWFLLLEVPCGPGGGFWCGTSWALALCTVPVVLWFFWGTGVNPEEPRLLSRLVLLGPCRSP